MWTNGGTTARWCMLPLSIATSIAAAKHDESTVMPNRRVPAMLLWTSVIELRCKGRNGLLVRHTTPEAEKRCHYAVYFHGIWSLECACVRELSIKLVSTNSNCVLHTLLSMQFSKSVFVAPVNRKAKTHRIRFFCRGYRIRQNIPQEERIQKIWMLFPLQKKKTKTKASKDGAPASRKRKLVVIQSWPRLLWILTYPELMRNMFWLDSGK